MRRRGFSEEIETGLFRAVVLGLWVATPGGGAEQPFHRGRISDSLHTRHLHYIHTSSKVIVMK